MKKIIVGVLSLILTGCASVYTEIEIDATPEEVWSVLVATEKYPVWNPVMIKADGKFVEGQKIIYQFKELSGKQYEIIAKVKKIVPNELINQRGGTFGILTFDHKFILEPTKNGTKVVQKEDYKGVYVPFWDHSNMEATYKKSNEALKKRVMEILEGKKHE